jgi:hypothetical protein
MTQRNQLTCRCAAYKFPHRKDGGACWTHGLEKQEQEHEQNLRNMTRSEYDAWSQAWKLDRA